jgi:DNA primase
MVNLDAAELRSKLDLEGKYVDFNLLRAALTVIKVVGDLNIELTEPTKEGECRGKCPKCDKDRSFCLNANTSRFKCFAKGCNLKGGGVIDFCAKLYEVSAKEASHLLACIYGIQPYDSDEPVGETQSAVELVIENPMTEQNGEVMEHSPNVSENVPPITAQHLIASIEQQLAELKQLLAIR